MIFPSSGGVPAGRGGYGKNHELIHHPDLPSSTKKIPQPFHSHGGCPQGGVGSLLGIKKMDEVGPSILF
jgi:hypothetical protein